MTDSERTVIFSTNGDKGQPVRLAAYEDLPLTEETEYQPVDVATGLVSLGYLAAAVRRAAWLCAVLAIVGLVIGVGVSVKKPPAYQASTSVLLTYSPDETPTSAILDEQAIAESRTVAQLAMSKLGLKESLASFAAAETVSIVTDRVLLFMVSAPSSSDAVSRANALTAAYLQFRAEQLRAGQKLLIKSLQQEVTQAQRQQTSISAQVSQLEAEPKSSAQQAELKELRGQLNQAEGTLSALEQTVAGTQASTATLDAITGSVVLDPAVPITHSRLKYLLIYAVTGLLGGLLLALIIVLLRATISGRLRRRDDVARALGAPVKLSVGPVKLSRWRPGRRGLAAAGGADARRVITHLHGLVPAGGKGPASLAVVPIGDSRVAALSVASLALSYAREGRRVVLADLAVGAPGATLLKASAPGVRQVTAGDARLVVAVPDRDDVAPTGPSRRPEPLAEPGHVDFSDAVKAAHEAADVLLALVTLDPSIGGEHLATWSGTAVAVVVAGQSSWTRIRAVGEMARLAGVSLVGGVLVGADKADESLGLPRDLDALLDVSDMG
jgi:capsular polysaccharide biosynthesis protein